MKVLIISKDGNALKTIDRRKAIHEKCVNCTGWIPKEVAGCTSKPCSLHPYRFEKVNQDAAKRQKAIKAFCLWCSNGQVGEISKCPSVNCPLFAYRKGDLDKTIKPTSYEKLGHMGGTFRVNITEILDDIFKKSA